MGMSVKRILLGEQGHRQRADRGVSRGGRRCAPGRAECRGELLHTRESFAGVQGERLLHRGGDLGGMSERRSCSATGGPRNRLATIPREEAPEKGGSPASIS